MNGPAQNGAADASAAKPGRSRASKLESKLDRTVRFMNWALMGLVLFCWLCWLILMAGTAALTADHTTYEASDAAITRETGFDWMLVWTSFVYLILLSAACAFGFGKRGRATLLGSARGFLFFAGILIAWLGVAANETAPAAQAFRDNVDDYNDYELTNEGEAQVDNTVSRIRAKLAGEILLVIALIVLAILLLVLDRSHTSATLRNMIEGKTGGGPTNVQVNASGQMGQSTGAPSAYAGSAYGGAAPPQFPQAPQQPAQYQQPNQPPQPPQVPGYYAQ